MPMDLFEALHERVERTEDHVESTLSGNMSSEFSTTRACGESVFSLC